MLHTGARWGGGGQGDKVGTRTVLSSPPGAAPLAARRPGLDIIVYCKFAMRHYSIDDVLPRAAPRHRAESRHVGPRRRARRGRGVGVGGFRDVGGGDLGTSGAPRGVGSAGWSQGPAAGGETVTITEFSNGNGSADGRARGTAWRGSADRAPPGAGLGAIKALTAPRLWFFFPSRRPRVLGVRWGSGVWGGTGNPAGNLGAGGAGRVLGALGGTAGGTGEHWGAPQGVLGSTRVHFRGHWGALGGTGVCCGRRGVY